jgi:hypothetical protein
MRQKRLEISLVWFEISWDWREAAEKQHCMGKRKSEVGIKPSLFLEQQY